MLTKTGHKYIICDAAPGNWGKSTTLLEVIKLFKANPSAFSILAEIIVGIDLWIVFQEVATSKIILIQTQGDYPSSFGNTINYLASGKNVDIIICASRTKGAPMRQVYSIASTYNFEQIHFSNFCPLRNNTLWGVSAISDVNKVHLAQLIYNFALAL